MQVEPDTDEEGARLVVDLLNAEVTAAGWA